MVESGNIDERVAVLSRVLEIMCSFEDMNNFTGLLEFYSALTSAAVFRLRHTWNVSNDVFVAGNNRETALETIER